MTRLIGLDIGTSFIKGAILDLEQATITSVRRVPFPPPVAGLPPLFHEVSPKAAVQRTRDLLAGLLVAAPDAAGVMACSQMHGFALVDTQNRPLTNIVTWLDQRAAQRLPDDEGTYYDALLDALPLGDVTARGKGMRVGLPVCALYWMAQNQVLPAGATVASLADYILAALAPARQAVRQVVEPTMAASHGSMDVAAAKWHHGILARLGLDGLDWPEIVPATAGSVYTLQIGERELPCHPIVGDHQCAVLGALVQPGELSLNISTGSQVSLIADSPASNDAETRPFFEGRFLRTMTRIPAGRALNVLVNLLTELSGGEAADSWQKIARAVERTPETDLRVDLSFFASETGDHGSIENIREDNLSVGHLFRGAFETMADNYLMCAQRLGARDEWQRLVFSGGLAQKLGTLRAAIQRRFDLPYRICPTSEDTLLGLMALGRRVYGSAASLDEACSQLLIDFRPEN